MTTRNNLTDGVELTIAKESIIIDCITESRDIFEHSVRKGIGLRQPTVSHRAEETAPNWIFLVVICHVCGKKSEYSMGN